MNAAEIDQLVSRGPGELVDLGEQGLALVQRHELDLGLEADRAAEGVGPAPEDR